MSLDIWNKFNRPPSTALKEIKGGALGAAKFSDINPQWRMMAMTDAFGPCGVGWWYEIVNIWVETVDDTSAVFAHINLYYVLDKETGGSRAIPGIGGSPIRKGGWDEAYKMALTDALSVAMKALGVAADIYLGAWDGSKYKDDDTPKQPAAKQTPPAYEPPKADILAQMDINEQWTPEGQKRFYASIGLVPKPLQSLFKRYVYDRVTTTYPEKPFDDDFVKLVTDKKRLPQLVKDFEAYCAQ